VRYSKKPETSQARKVNFSGPGKGKHFSKHLKTPQILTQVFQVVFLGLLRELSGDWFKEPKLTPLH